LTGRAQGIIVRNLRTGQVERYSADAVVLATGCGKAPFISPPTPCPAMSPRRGGHSRISDRGLQNFCLLQLLACYSQGYCNMRI